MISLKKLLTLPESSQCRKIIQILRDFLDQPSNFPLKYVEELSSLTIRILEKQSETNTVHRNRSLLELKDYLSSHNIDTLFISRLRFLLLEKMDISEADWDFTLRPAEFDLKKRDPFPIKMYLDDIRSAFNVGSLFRTAEALGIQEILISPFCADPLHPRALRSSMGCVQRIPWKRSNPIELSAEGNLFCLETNGIPIDRFTFPSHGLVIIGSEEFGVSPETLALAKKRLGIVSIPLAGSKVSLNVGVAAGILLQTWINQLNYENI